jgi:MFS transporter, putative metabolite:H+ symporter
LPLALIAGTSNIVSPKATEGALFGSFLVLAFGMALVGLSFAILGRETHGRAMSLGGAEQPAGRQPVVLGAETR